MILCNTDCSASSVGSGTSTNSGAPSMPRRYTPSSRGRLSVAERPTSGRMPDLRRPDHHPPAQCTAAEPVGRPRARTGCSGLGGGWVDGPGARRGGPAGPLAAGRPARLAAHRRRWRSLSRRSPTHPLRRGGRARHPRPGQCRRPRGAGRRGHRGDDTAAAGGGQGLGALTAAWAAWFALGSAAHLGIGRRGARCLTVPVPVPVPVRMPVPMPMPMPMPMLVAGARREARPQHEIRRCFKPPGGA